MINFIKNFKNSNMKTVQLHDKTFELFIPQEKIRAKLIENWKKPVKRSSWQQRMEALAKQQQANARKK